MQLTALYRYLETYHESLPVISTASSILKIVCMAMIQPRSELLKKHYYISLSENSLLRHIVLLVPFLGNVTIALYDHKKRCDFEYALECVKVDGLSLYYALDDSKNNKKIVDVAIKKNKASLAYANDSIRNDFAYIEKKMQKDPSILLYAGNKVRSSDVFLLKMMTLYDTSILQYALPILLENPCFIEKGIKIYPQTLKYSKSLRKNEDFVYRAALINEQCLTNASKNIRKNLNFFKKLIKINPSALQYADREIRSCEFFIHSELQTNQDIFQYSDLQSDRNFIIKRINEDLSFLQQVSDQFKKDKEFVKLFPKNNFEILKYADPSIRNDLKFNIFMVHQHQLSLQWVIDDLKNNEELVFTYVELNLLSELIWADKTLMQNPQFAKRCFKQNEKSLNFFCDSLKKDSEFILQILDIRPQALQFADISLQKDETFILKCISKKQINISFSLFKNDENFLLKAIHIDPSVARYIDTNLRSSYVFFHKAMLVNPAVLKYSLEGDLSYNESFFWELIQTDPTLFRYASNTLKMNINFIKKFIFKDCGTFCSLKKTLFNLTILNYVDTSFKGNRPLLEKFRYYQINPLPYANETLRLDLKFNINALPKSILNYYYKNFNFETVHPFFKNCEEFLYKAAEITDQVIKWASSNFQNDKDFAYAIISRRADVFMTAHSQNAVDEEERPLCIEHLKETPSPLAFMGKDLQNDFEIVLRCTYYDANALDYASPELQKDERLTFDKHLHGKGDRNSMNCIIC